MNTQLRIVSAQRARHLRKRGVYVWFACETRNGHSRYFWRMPK